MTDGLMDLVRILPLLPLLPLPPLPQATPFDGAATEIAQWDGAVWSAVGAGLTGGTVYTLAVYDGLLIAGGTFVASGSTAVNGIAQWDGIAWAALEAEVSEPYLYALAAYTPTLASKESRRN